MMQKLAGRDLNSMPCGDISRNLLFLGRAKYHVMCKETFICLVSKN